MLNQVLGSGNGSKQILPKIVLGLASLASPANASRDRGIDDVPHRMERIDLELFHNPQAKAAERFHQLKPDDFNEFGLTDLTDMLEGKKELPPILGEN